MHSIGVDDFADDIERRLISSLGGFNFAVRRCSSCSEIVISELRRLTAPPWKRFCKRCRKLSRKMGVELVRRPTQIRPGKLCVRAACTQCGDEQCFTAYLPPVEILHEDNDITPSIENRSRTARPRKDPQAAAFAARFSRVMVRKKIDDEAAPAKEVNSR